MVADRAYAEGHLLADELRQRLQVNSLVLRAAAVAE
jgi:hypothetical protein